LRRILPFGKHINLAPICIPKFSRGQAKRLNNTAAWVVGWADSNFTEGVRSMNSTTKVQYYANVSYGQTHLEKRVRFYAETDSPAENIVVSKNNFYNNEKSNWKKIYVNT
jgi:hypothetical protein